MADEPNPGKAEVPRTLGRVTARIADAGAVPRYVKAARAEWLKTQKKTKRSSRFQTVAFVSMLVMITAVLYMVMR